MSNIVRRAYNAGPIEPLCEVGQNLLLETPLTYDLYSVAFIEPLSASTPLILNLANVAGATPSLAGGASTQPIDVKGQVSMGDGELGQLRFMLLDPVHVALNQGRGLGRQTTRTQQSLWTPIAQRLDPDCAGTEHYIFGINTSFLVATNPFPALALSFARVAFWGFRYVLAGLQGANLQGGSSSIQPIQSFHTLSDWFDYARTQSAKATIVPISGWAH